MNCPTITSADPAHPDFFGEVRGINLREALNAQHVEAIERGMDKFAVLVFRGQAITNEQQIAFSRNFGEIEPAYGAPGDTVQAGRLPREINDISNLDRNNLVLALNDRQRLYYLGNLLWHSDSSYKQVTAKYSMLSAHAIPDRGGDTQFADMRAAWDSLDGELREHVAALVCEHSRLYSRQDLGFEFSADEVAKYAPIAHPLVRRHPVTGRLSLFLSAHGGAIRGMTLPEGRVLLMELKEHATQWERVHTHVWKLNDLVMWDNRVTMHRGKRFPANQPRDLRRTTLMDTSPP